MPIDSVPAGSNQRQVVALGDNSLAANVAAVIAPGDAINTSGKFASLINAIKLLVNPVTGNKDMARAAPGTTGVQSVSPEGTKATYSSASIAFTPVATATDFYTLSGSGTKTVRLNRITVSGFATAAISVDIQLLKRSTANSAGASSAPTIVPHDTNNAAATAVISLWSANPTLGTLVGAFRGRKLNLGATGAAGTVEWRFGDTNDQAFVLRGVAESLNLNWNGAAVPAGTLLDIECEFVEDGS